MFRQDILQGRVALITGGGSGIGFEIARQLGTHGCKVVIFGRRKDFLEDAVKQMAQSGVTGLAVPGDVRKGEDCQRAVHEAVEKFGSLDILVNNAAGNFLAVTEDLSVNGFKTIMEIDAIGVFTMSTAAFPELKKSKVGGNIINITAQISSAWYQIGVNAAKSAIDAMTRNLALEWGSYGIRTNSIAPGPIADTPGLTKLGGAANLEMAKQIEKKISRGVPVGRMGTTSEIAQTCIFLCANDYISGDKIIVDGGSWLHKKPPMPREAVLSTAKSVEKGSRGMGANAKL